MSKSLITRLSTLEALHEGQESPRPAIVGIRGVDGVIRADIPGQTEPEAFSDEAALEARANPAAWLEQREIYGDLADNPAFVAAFTQTLNAVWQNGTAATIRAYLA